MVNRNKKLLLAGAALVALSPMSAGLLSIHPAQAKTAPIIMKAVVLQAIALASVQSLNFGTFSQPGGADVITVNTAGAATYNSLNAIALTAPTEGIVNLKASAGYAIDIGVTNTTATVDDVGAGVPMVVDNFQVRTNAGGTAEVVTLTTGQVAAGLDVPIGGDLNVNAAQAAGTYTGTFTVSANYQ